MRGRGFAGLLALLAAGAPAHAKPPTPPAKNASRASTSSTPAVVPVAAAAPARESRPAPSLPMLPNVARVTVDVARDHVVVTEEVRLPRGGWVSGGLDLYAAFGAPGAPVAIDARIGPAPAGLDARAEEAGDPVAVESAVRRAPSASLLLGRPQMAGVVIHVKDADLRRIYAAAEAAALRIRSLLGPPVIDARGTSDVVVRLGIAGDLPLTVGRIEVNSREPDPWITRAEASLCGPEADGWPLAVTLTPRLAEPPSAAEERGGERRSGPIAPAMAVRHASDDLCVRWWTKR